MGTWVPQSDTSTHNIPATAGTYNNDPYYIGLLKNDEPNTTEAISDLTITKSAEWIKDAYIDPQTKSPNGDYYPLTYKVDENTDKSEREGYILITHNAANKTLKYIIKLAAKGPTEPTLNEYVFLITNYSNNSNKNYVLQVRGHSADPKNNVSFATIKANAIKLLSIDIKIGLSSTNSWDELNFNFTIIVKGFEFDSSINLNGGPTSWKSVYIMLGGERKGFLRVECSDNSGLKIRITIFSNNLNPKALALLSEDISTGVLSEDITGKIAIKNSTHEIPFKVTFGFS